MGKITSIIDTRIQRLSKLLSKTKDKSKKLLIKQQIIDIKFEDFLLR